MTDIAKRPSTNFIWLLVGWIAVSFGLRLYFLDNLRWTYDEGIHALLAQLLARGYEPYREVFISYPPLYTLSIDWGWRVFGSVEGLQIVMTLYTMPGLLAVGLIGWRLGGTWAGLAAAIFVSLEPEFFRGSRAVLTEVPALSMAALSIALAAFYYWGPPQKSGPGLAGRLGAGPGRQPDAQNPVALCPGTHSANDSGSAGAIPKTVQPTLLAKDSGGWPDLGRGPAHSHCCLHPTL